MPGIGSTCSTRRAIPISSATRCRARCGRDRGDRDQRAERHRDDDEALHGLGRQARAGPADHRNKIDAENVNLPSLLEAIQDTFGKECLPLNLPAAGATKVSDCFFSPTGESDFSSVEEAHGKLVDQVVEVDES
jgi:hypothetical protein